MAITDGVALNVHTNRDNFQPDVTFYDSISQYLPPSVEAWLGVECMNPMVYLDEEAVDELNEWDRGAAPDNPQWFEHTLIALAELNDHGVPFPIIAGLIERVM